MQAMTDYSPMMYRVQGMNGSPKFEADLDGGGFDVSASFGGTTNTRVAGSLVAAGIMLALLKYLGFRFNVGVTS